MKNIVLVTGADGFIGSHLTEILCKRGYIVKALAHYNSFNSWGWLDEVTSINYVQIITGDITDPFFCQEILKDVSIVFNLAALIAVPYSYKMPLSYLKTNIEGTLNICQAARQNNNVRVIQTSSSEVYGSAQYIPMDEKHPKRPQSPYAASKVGSDAIAMSYYFSYGLPVTIARPFNTYGPRQSSRAVIPSIITQIANYKKKIRVGNLNPLRDFNYVSDICNGLINLSECAETIGKEINICSNSETSIEEIFNMIRGIMKSEAIPEIDDQLLRPDLSEVLRLKGDNTLIKEFTGWEPKVSLSEGLKRTCEWYKKPENLRRFKSEINNF